MQCYIEAYPNLNVHQFHIVKILVWMRMTIAITSLFVSAVVVVSVTAGTVKSFATLILVWFNIWITDIVAVVGHLGSVMTDQLFYSQS